MQPEKLLPPAPTNKVITHQTALSKTLQMDLSELFQQDIHHININKKLVYPVFVCVCLMSSFSSCQVCAGELGLQPHSRVRLAAVNEIRVNLLIRLGEQTEKKQ